MLGRHWQTFIVGLIATGATLMVLSSRRDGGLGYEESLEKLQLFVRASHLALDHFALGVGRGAFGSAFSTYQVGAGTSVFEHAENLPLQWAAEWGAPVSVAAFCAMGWSL